MLEEEKIIVASALLSIERLTDIQLATINIVIAIGLPAKDKDGFETVSHLFDEEGYLLNPIFKEAFAIEINRRVAEGKGK